MMHPSIAPSSLTVLGLREEVVTCERKSLSELCALASSASHVLSDTTGIRLSTAMEGFIAALKAMKMNRESTPDDWDSFAAQNSWFNAASEELFKSEYHPLSATTLDEGTLVVVFAPKATNERLALVRY